MEEKITNTKLALDKINSLPTPSPVLRRIGKILADPDASVVNIVDALKLDPAVAGRVLKLANSAYIGIPRTVSSLQNAVVLLGLRRIHSLLLSTELIRPLSIKTGTAFTIESFWRHSLTTAMIAESIAKHLRRYEAVDTEEFFSAAILHDIGKLALCILDPEAIDSALRKSSEQNIPFYQAEDPELSHTTAGSLIASHWNFPQGLQQAIQGHHDPSSFTESIRLVAIVHVSDIMAHLLGYTIFEKENSPQFDEKALSLVQLPPERLRVIAENALMDEKQVESLLEVFNG